MDTDDLIKRVVDESGRSTEEIKSKIDERKKRTHGLLSDYGAIYAVAKEYGINLSESEMALSNISEIKPQNSVNICGRVKIVYSPREFQRKDNTTSKFASIILIDKSGEIRMVLWDANTELTKKVRVGDILLAKNLYSKENNGLVEVHAGSLTTITVNPSNMKVNLPEVEEKLIKISDLDLNTSSANLLCRVSSYHPKMEFDRQDGSKGLRASFIGEDESGKIRVVLWDASAEAGMQSDDVVKLENAYVREGLNGELELHVGNRGRVFRTEAKLNLPPLVEGAKTVLKVGEVKPQMSGFNVSARVIRIYEPREYSGGMMASLIVADETGSIRTVLWNDKSEIANGLKEGDGIKIINAYSKANMNDEPEIHVGKLGDVKVDSTGIPLLSDVAKKVFTEKKIADLDVGDAYVRVSGRVVDVDVERPLFYMTCPSCGRRVQNLGGEWLCDSCGIVDPDHNMLASVTLEDDTGSIRVVSFKANAEKILGVSVDEAMNVIGETQDESEPLKRARDRMAGKMVSAAGRVKYNEFSDQLELLAEDVELR